ncbi:MAG: DNA mismatch repair endonuclease MutL, partial [Bacteroidota bacterium]|nr:DNA mismatch repair endonuclease MutL [Bacteroidota bacterium]
MGDIISLLPEHVANQIAAGEVVQRPSSVVKELLENSIDANSRNIIVNIQDAGKSYIQILDNGIGMTRKDAELCFERHATSKIKNANDLFKIKTKGFRGEALASISAVSQVELITKTKNDELGYKINIQGSKISNTAEVTSSLGTSVVVKNLFFNIPARRSFLKSNQVEFRHIIDEFHRVALIHNQIHFELNHNNAEIFHLKATSRRQRIVDIFGKKFDERLVPVNEETEILKINGFVQKPEFAKKTKHQQFFFVNDRYIKSPFLNHS